MDLTHPHPWLDGHPFPEPAPIVREIYEHDRWLRAARDPTMHWTWLAYLGAHYQGGLEWDHPLSLEVPCAVLANPNLTQRAASYVLQAHGHMDYVGLPLDAPLALAFAGNPIVTLWMLDDLAWPRHLSAVALETLCKTPEAVRRIGPSLGAACIATLDQTPTFMDGNPLESLRQTAREIGGRALQVQLLGEEHAGREWSGPER